MTFDECFKTCPIPGEFDAIDACDKDRWTGVMRYFFEAGQRSVLEGEPYAWLPGNAFDAGAKSAPAYDTQVRPYYDPLYRLKEKKS